MELEQLKLLGLNTYEIKAYTTLLKKGKSKVSTIIEDSQVPSGKIYETLDSLEKKGLVAIVPDKIKYYIPKSIENLKAIIQEKQKELTKLNTQLDDFKEIIEQRSDGEITLVRGKRNFHRLIKEIPIDKTFNYTIKWNADVNDMNIQKSVKDSLKRGVKHKVLYGQNVKEENLKIWSKYGIGEAFIKTNGVAMNINDNSVMISIVNLNSTMLIKSKEFVEVMKQLFDGYYDNQKSKK